MDSLKAKIREPFGEAQALRRAGLVPAIVYGSGLKPTSVSVEKMAFDKLWREAGESTLIDLVIDNQSAIKVLIKDVQKDPVKDFVQHIDFHQIRMDEKLITEIPLKFIGEAPAVKEFGGMLVRNFDHFKVECLPQDLVHVIEVDASILKELNRGLTVKEIQVPKGIKVLMGEDEVVASVIPPRSEEELAKLKTEVEKVDVTKVEKVATKKPAEEADGDKK